MTLLDRLRAATPNDLDRDAADVLGLTTGTSFGIDRAGLTVGNETVPFDVAAAEFARVLQPPPFMPRDWPRSRITIADL